MNTHLNYPGSKKRIAQWIIRNMPEHHSYLEPFFGGGAVLFEKDPARIETVNDIDGEVINFFRTIQNPDQREKLCELIAYTPYSREMYDCSFRKQDDNIARAASFAIRSIQSYGFRSSDKNGWKKDVYGREAAYAVRYWNKLPEALQFVGRRLKSVQIENRPALELIRKFNNRGILIYCDPPYVLSTKYKRMYKYEMIDDEHEELLTALCDSNSKVMISGYDCALYDKYLKDWRKEKTVTRTQSGAQREETLWMNY